ncbi:hypothetical protein FCG67_10795 [Rhodococcus oryzae]|uniref:Uncharacterized protein n=1 Tax=Rhodococcus oryzae TaxID=2571143 RepID=A0ABY2RL90_9NOCA|nr:hypothetical protein [Rhodococcus oryzae]TJZ78510.1 hypothetical protein FCG67_10795 [Rhodococcus oryzae]
MPSPSAPRGRAHRQPTGESRYVAEQYVDRDACDAHFAPPYVSGLLSRFPELLAGKPQVEYAETVTSFVA